MRRMLIALPLLLLASCDPHGDLPNEGDDYQRARERAELDCNVWLDALEDFRQEFERYPSGSEGLRLLVIVPQDHLAYPIWNGPYGEADESFLMDPWKRPYHFESTGEHIAIISEGRDRTLNTGDDIKVERRVFY